VAIGRLAAHPGRSHYVRPGWWFRRNLLTDAHNFRFLLRNLLLKLVRLLAQCYQLGRRIQLTAS